MDSKTTIVRTKANWTCITGCSKLSPGCKFCTAERVWPRLAGNDKTLYYNRSFSDVKCHPSELGLPAAWSRPRMVSVNPMSDTFHPSISDAFIDQMFAIMMLAGQHTFQVLTKRIDRAGEYLSAPERKEKVAAAARALLASGNDAYSGYAFSGEVQWPLPNVWIGASVEDQKSADERIVKLLNLPAALWFISIEPFIGDINLLAVRDADGTKQNVLTGARKLGWVTIGCETGMQRRKLDIDWVRSVRSMCHNHGVPLHISQLFISGKLVSDPILDGRQWVDSPVSGQEIMTMAVAA